MSKWLVLSIEGHNNSPRARMKPLKPKHLILGDHGLLNLGQKPVCSYIGVLSSNTLVPPFLGKMGGPTLTKY